MKIAPEITQKIHNSTLKTLQRIMTAAQKHIDLAAVVPKQARDADRAFPARCNNARRSA